MRLKQLTIITLIFLISTSCVYSLSNNYIYNTYSLRSPKESHNPLDYEFGLGGRIDFDKNKTIDACFIFERENGLNYIAYDVYYRIKKTDILARFLKFKLEGLQELELNYNEYRNINNQSVNISYKFCNRLNLGYTVNFQEWGFYGLLLYAKFKTKAVEAYVKFNYDTLLSKIKVGYKFKTKNPKVYIYPYVLFKHEIIGGRDNSYFQSKIELRYKIGDKNEYKRI